MDDKCIIHWNTASAPEWTKHLEGAGLVAYQQHYAYGEVAKALGAKVLRAVIEYDGEPVAVVQLLKRRVLGVFNITAALRGPIWLNEVSDEVKARCYESLKSEIPRKFPSFVFISPASDDSGVLQGRRVMTGYSTVIIDLTKPEEELLADMDGKWRNRLKAAQKNSLVIKAVSPKPEKYEWLLKKEAEQAGKVGYLGLGAGFVQKFQAAEGKDSLLILRVEHEGETIGAVMMIIHGNHATYHIGWSNEQGKKLGAHNLLMWEVIRKLKQRNVTALDLGGVNTENHGAGIARFKLGLCNNLVQLPGTYIA